LIYAFALAPNRVNEHTLFAVRSSATDEDSSVHSFAGQFKTYLNVPKAQVIKSIKKVQQSANSEHVVAYMHERGIEERVSTPAVLVQQMVKTDCAGVAFGANPSERFILLFRSLLYYISLFLNI
jgi:pyruvate,water dikinase